MNKTMVGIAAIAFIGCICALGQPAGAAGPPINVQKCDPRAGGVTAAPGYVRGYYPAGPYYFYDVYGYRYMQPMVAANPTLSIDFRNASSVVANMVEFGLVARGRLVAEVRDEGTFSPNIEIKHQYGLSPNVFPLGTGLPLCAPLRVRFADGTMWVNPRLPALRRSLYAP